MIYLTSKILQKEIKNINHQLTQIYSLMIVQQPMHEVENAVSKIVFSGQLIHFDDIHDNTLK